MTTSKLADICCERNPQPADQWRRIEKLLLSGVDVHATDKNGVTALHHAVRFRSPAAVRALVAHGANVNQACRRSGGTPLHRAVTQTGAPGTAGRGEAAREIVETLLAAGADPSIANKSGKRPIDYVTDQSMRSLLQRKSLGKGKKNALEPTIVDRPAQTFVGLEASFLHALSPETTNYKVIPPLWERFSQRAREVQGRVGQAMYGVIFGRPESERSHPHELQYIAAVAVSSAANLPAGMTSRFMPAGMTSRTVPAGKFALFTHRGPIHLIGETCREIYRVWLPQSAWQHALIADIEVYDHRFCPDGEDSEVDYWISIRPKA